MHPIRTWPSPRHCLKILLVAVVFFLTGKLGLLLAAVSFDTVATIWPPSGFALWAVLLGGSGMWQGVFLGSLVLNLLRLPWYAALGVAATSTLAAILSARWLRHKGFDDRLSRMRDVFMLAGVVAFLNPTFAGTLGVLCNVWGAVVPWDRYGAAWWMWWVGDLMGILIVAPLLLTWRPAPLPAWRSWRVIEVVALTFSLIVVGVLVFGSELSVARLAYPYTYLLFPLLIWSAVRFGPRGAAGASFLVSVLAIAGTAQGGGPFVRETLSHSLLFLQVFIGLQAMTALLLAGAISELRLATAEIARRNAELEQAKELDRLKNNFVNAVSHEIRTPLTSIMGYAEFLEDELGGPLTQDQREFVHQLSQGAKRLEYLVSDLLDFARIEAGTFHVRIVPSDFSIKLAEILESLRPQAEAARLTIKAEMPPNPLPIAMDAERIGQVLTNLLHNAIKFTPPEGDIRVKVQAQDEALVCEVSDTGIGIAAQDLPRLFQRFMQLENGVKRGVGTGLGLNISKTIVEAHGGTIGVRSEEGAGSTFWFSLPLSS
ncbi:MASE1 domain-containing protein [bacterium]|nr:MASE1 domain-containing protein [bacterium]